MIDIIEFKSYCLSAGYVLTYNLLVEKTDTITSTQPEKKKSKIFERNLKCAPPFSFFF